jgi:hypothetical protein
MKTYITAFMHGRKFTLRADSIPQTKLFGINKNVADMLWAYYAQRLREPLSAQNKHVLVSKHEDRFERTDVFGSEDGFVCMFRDKSSLTFENRDRYEWDSIDTKVHTGDEQPMDGGPNTYPESD